MKEHGVGTSPGQVSLLHLCFENLEEVHSPSFFLFSEINIGLDETETLASLESSATQSPDFPIPRLGVFFSLPPVGPNGLFLENPN